ncbi:MAG TPA: 4-alpha-glucanotransferase [bacterium]|nr:4-alpha-glucanotransferase [bacterium]HOL35036.1 4-alpha-glucanotransferase [bacterium]
MDISDYLLSTPSNEKWKKIGTRRRAGILMPLFSIHSSSSVGTGDFHTLKYMADLCRKIGCTILQILPLNYPGADNCPYNAISSFAIDPVYISLEDFFYNGFSFSNSLIRQLHYCYLPGKNHRCNYIAREIKLNLLNEVFLKFFDDICSDKKFLSFTEQNQYWLDDFAIYRVLKKLNNDEPWYNWEKCFSEKNKEKIAQIEYSCRKEVLFEKWIQYICFNQLVDVRQYIRKKDVLFMGDMPVLASKDSADVWSKRSLFDLEFVAGAPPDMYCVFGQRWGMPVQNWDNVRKTNFEYIAKKMKYLDNFFDMIRIDHVVGFFRIWAIPATEPEENQGINGVFIPQDESQWKSHGKEILSNMNQFSKSLLCGEDLGIIPSVCTETLKELGILGYEVQRWKKNYGTNYSFIPFTEYRELAISTLSTHDTSFWIEWLVHEAGTVDRDLFALKCKRAGISPEPVIEYFFEKSNRPDRLRWKKEISKSKIFEILGDSTREFLEIYTDTFYEKENLLTLLGMTECGEISCLKKALQSILQGSSIFCINLLTDMFCIDPFICSQISHLRINKPGTSGLQNWSFAFEQSLEELMENPVVADLREMVKNSGR